MPHMTMDTAFNTTAATQEAGSFPYGRYVLLFMLLFAIVAAAGVLLVSAWRRKKRKVKTEVFLISWSVADIVCGLTLAGTLVVGIIVGTQCWSVYGFLRGAIPVMCVAMPAMHLLVLSLERLLAVIYSVLHEIYWTRKRVLLYLGAVWCVTLTLPFPLLIGESFSATYILVILPILYILGAIVPLLVYIKIVYTASEHERSIHVTTTLTYENFLHEVWVSKLYLIQTIFFLLLWLPFIIITFLKNPKWAATMATTDSVELGVFALGLSNGFVHTAIYILSRRNIKLACQKLFECPEY